MDEIEFYDFNMDIKLIIIKIRTSRTLIAL